METSISPDIAAVLKKLTDEEINCLKQFFSKKSENSKIVRSSFSQEEDDELRRLVGIYGTKKWSMIAEQMPGRSVRQCRERWSHYLSPQISNNEWTQEEDMKLLQFFKIIGSSWKKYVPFFNNRTDINIRNRWVVLMRKASINKSLSCSQPTPCHDETKNNEVFRFDVSQFDDSFIECDPRICDDFDLDFQL